MCSASPLFLTRTYVHLCLSVFICGENINWDFYIACQIKINIQAKT